MLTMEIPAGAIMAFAGSQLPAGWQWCFGQSESSLDPNYKTLFAAIGTAHGGDGNPKFNLPDYRGRFLRGVDHGAGNDPDTANRTTPQPTSGNGGDQVGSLQGDVFSKHSHTTPANFLQADGGTGFIGHGFDSNSGNDPSGQQTSTSSGVGGNETRPKNAYVEFIIKL